jgi:hypothetical protein
MSDETTAVDRVEPALPERADMQAGVAALSEMSQQEFSLRLQSLKRGRERLRQIHQELMDPVHDYGVIPGTKKPTLLKAGAEKLCSFYRLAAEFRPVITYGNGQDQPAVTVVTECRLHLGTLDGPVVNTGHGACNDWERRYRSQRADPFDLLNTLLKMSEKRAYVDATLRATATSSLYSQDLEDGNVRPNEAPASRQRGNSHQDRSQLARGGQPAAGGPGARPVAAASAPGGAPARPVVADESTDAIFCEADGCGVALTDAEIAASEKHFEGAYYCTIHGREALAQKRQTEQAHAELDAEMDAAATE